MADIFKKCWIHFQNTEIDSHINTFTDITWKRVLEFASEWEDLDGEAQAISDRFKKMVEKEFLSICKCGFHRKCYQYFTCTDKLKRAKKRSQHLDSNNNVSDNVTAEDSITTVSKPLTRKSYVSSVGNFLAKNRGVLPLTCFICQEKKWEKTRRGSYRESKLRTCQGDVKELFSRAIENNDDRIVNHLKMCTDLASTKVVYHHNCYRGYMRPRKSSKAPNTSPEHIVFEQFCSDVVEEKLFKNKCVLSMKALHQQYLQLAVKNSVPLPMKRQTLKSKIFERFPDLKLLRQNERNKSYLVYFCDEALSKELDTMIGDGYSIDGGDSDSESEMEQEESPRRDYSIPSERFMSSLELRETLRHHKSPLDMWPPLASDLIVATAKKSVPFDLFNTLAHITGLAKEPVDDDC